VRVAIPKKYTTLRMKLKFSVIVWTEIGPTGTTESCKKCVIRFLTKKSLIGCIMVDHLGREMINKKNSGKKNFIPKFHRHRSVV
jgi:hypothetical protein